MKNKNVFHQFFVGISKATGEIKKVMSPHRAKDLKEAKETTATASASDTPPHRVMTPQIVNGVPEVSCEKVFDQLGKVRLIDVRRPDEFNNELGHIPGAELVPLGSELTAFLKQGDRNQEIVFICRSGGRSGCATTESIELGYKATINMTGGMLRWNELNLKTERF